MPVKNQWRNIKLSLRMHQIAGFDFHFCKNFPGEAPRTPPMAGGNPLPYPPPAWRCRAAALCVATVSPYFQKISPYFHILGKQCHVCGSFNLVLATTGDVWIIPSFRIGDYVLQVEHVSCVITNRDQHWWVIPSLSIAHWWRVANSNDKST